MTFDEYLEIVSLLVSKIDGYDEWSEERKLDFLTEVVKIMRPPSVSLDDIFTLTKLPDGAGPEFPLDYFVVDKQKEEHSA
jgi:hypothetical protein